jgi:integrase
MVIDSGTGEDSLALRDKGNLSNKTTLKVLLDIDGKSIYPQNLFLHHLISSKGLKKADTYSQSLLAYTRWLSLCNYKYDDIKAIPSEGVVWMFADFLIDNLRQVEPNGRVINPDGFALSTARTYASHVISFYKWLHHEVILPFSSSFKPFNIINGTRKAGGDGDMLSHTWKGSNISFQTSDIMKRFPNIQTTEAHKKLKPMTKGDLSILKEAMNCLPTAFQLMFQLMLDVGLRLSEVATFPEDIESPILPLTAITIGPINGVTTKFGKIRTVKIPEELATSLYIHLLSTKRRNNLKRNGVKINNDGYSTKGHGRLFVNERGEPYSPNTIAREWIKLRANIIKKHPNWYYRVHDARSTYATYWLATEQAKRRVTYNYLLDELKELLGHNSSTVTLKYIKFLESEDTWIDHSLNKNNKVSSLLVNDK